MIPKQTANMMLIVLALKSVLTTNALIIPVLEAVVMGTIVISKSRPVCLVL
jgi:hypothetical protein